VSGLSGLMRFRGSDPLAPGLVSRAPGHAPLLEVRDLRVSFQTEGGLLRAVDGVSFTVARGEVVAIVGESGSGKTVTAMTLMGLTRSPGARFEGAARFAGVDLLAASQRRLRELRGARIAMVFQDPMSSLNPVQRVGEQIVEQLRAHQRGLTRAHARARAIELMRRVSIPHAAERVRCYPHELSGGMRQRVMIAMALSCGPELLIADEPTTALDVTIQAQIIRELADLREQTGAGILLVTHDLGVVAEIADRVIVMYAGQVVEQGMLEELFYDARHPYTWGLLGSIAHLERDRSRRLPAIPGTPPSLIDSPRGCRFRPRCRHAFERCVEAPPLVAAATDEPEHRDRCFLELAQKSALRTVDGGVGAQAAGKVSS
jgi:oligopeptide/dipeptide ABC transporter ATP-binding protein